MYDPAQRRFFDIPLKSVTPPPSENIYLYSICQTADGAIWAGGSHGLYWLPPQQTKSSETPVFQQIPLHRQGAATQEVEFHNFVYTVYPSANQPNALWIGCKQGLNLLDISTGFGPGSRPISERIRYFEHRENDPTSLSHNFATSVCEGDFPNKNAVWVATFNGLNLLDPATGRFRHFFAKEDGTGGLQANYVRSLRFDQSGILWVGTNRG